MSDKIVIRINNPRPAKLDPTASTPQVVVYHWHRIGTALAIVALAVGGIVMGVRHVQQPATTATESAGAPSAPAPLTTASAPIASPPATESDQPAETASRPALETAPPGAQPAHPGTEPHATTAPLAVASPSRHDEPVDAASSDSTAQALADVAPAPASTAVAESRIKSPAIRRLLLTSEIKDGMPVDELGGALPMNAKGLLKVFLFMETSGLKGRVLYHDWYWKDRRIAHARVPLRHSPQNAATSKYIDRIMVGPWLVKVVDERDHVYAETRFEVH